MTLRPLPSKATREAVGWSHLDPPVDTKPKSAICNLQSEIIGTLRAHSLPGIPLRGVLVSLMAAWYTNEAMMTAFFIKSSMGSVSKKSRLV